MNILLFIYLIVYYYCLFPIHETSAQVGIVNMATMITMTNITMMIAIMTPDEQNQQLLFTH